jgi:cytochrome oxidase Cu insertion factor (SCO1/SenC/PrrC family)/ABC-type Zn2+ transport system substrate-binding protein/surface adhesin
MSSSLHRIRRVTVSHPAQPRLAIWAFLLLIVPIIPAAAGDLNVVVSSKPVHSLLSALMQGTGTPTLLQRDEVPPWRYQADAQTLSMLQQADLVVWVGPELERELGRQLTDSRPRGRVVELLASEALKILPARGQAQGRDPWFWLDTRNMLILADEMTRILAELDPKRSHAYQRNRLAVLSRLSRLDSELEYAYRDVSGTPVMLYHDTQQYFEQAYALKVAARATEAGAESPATANILRLRGLIGQARLSCLFVEAGIPAPHLDLLQTDGHGRIVELKSLGNGLAPGPDLYEQLMRANFSAFRDCAADTKAERPQAVQRPELPAHRIQTRYLLEDHHGVPRTNLDFPGQFQLIYFGYTFCPDICPTSLAVVAQALELLGPRAERIQPLFITVDPARDTREVLRGYTQYFHPRLLGLIGSDEMVARVAAGFRVQYEKVPSDTDPQRYSMDHTSSLFLLGPDGDFLAKFAHGLPAEELARRLEQIIPANPET